MPDQLVPLSIAKSDTFVYWLLCNANATLSPFCYAHLCNRVLYFYSIHYAVDQLSGLFLTHLSLKQPMPGLKMDWLNDWCAGINNGSLPILLNIFEAFKKSMEI